MPVERKQRLDAIGFVWDPHESGVGGRLCSANDVQSPRRSLSRASTFMSKARSSLGGGSVNSDETKIRCPLNAGSDWMPSDLFGIRTKVHGKKVLQR